jgi:hypothetical protein
MDSTRHAKTSRRATRRVGGGAECWVRRSPAPSGSPSRPRRLREYPAHWWFAFGGSGLDTTVEVTGNNVKTTRSYRGPRIRREVTDEFVLATLRANVIVYLY